MNKNFAVQTKFQNRHFSFNFEKANRHFEKEFCARLYLNQVRIAERINGELVYMTGTYADLKCKNSCVTG